MFLYWIICPSHLRPGTLAQRVTTEPRDLAMLEKFKQSRLLREHLEYLVYIRMMEEGHWVSLDALKQKSYCVIS